MLYVDESTLLCCSSLASVSAAFRYLGKITKARYSGLMRTARGQSWKSINSR